MVKVCRKLINNEAKLMPLNISLTIICRNHYNILIYINNKLLKFMPDSWQNILFFFKLKFVKFPYIYEY